MLWCYCNNSALLLNTVKNQIFQFVENLKNFEIDLYVIFQPASWTISQPAMRPTSARPKIQFFLITKVMAVQAMIYCSDEYPFTVPW